MDEVMIRSACPEDAAALLAIYAPYVTDTAISFEYEVPSEEEFLRRMSHIQKRYPYYVAVSGQNILGYAYAAPFVGRAAYDWSVETTIYLRQDIRHKGVGRKLYEALEYTLKQMHILNMNACIGVPKEDDQHLDHNSMGFHQHMGFSLVGTFHDSGYKFDTWYDMVWMEKIIGTHHDHPAPVLSFDQVRENG